MENLSLFDLPEFGFTALKPKDQIRAMARNTDPDTAWEAAKRQMPDLTEKCYKVFLCLLEYPEGLTDFEISVKTKMVRTSAGKRRKDLGVLVESTGEKRPTDTGTPAIVWKLKNL